MKVEDERAVVMGPSTPLRRGAEGHPTGLKEGRWEEEGREGGKGGRGGQEGLVQEASIVGQAPLSGLVRQ
jgi:hypothetical protein